MILTSVELLAFKLTSLTMTKDPVGWHVSVLNAFDMGYHVKIRLSTPRPKAAYSSSTTGRQIDSAGWKPINPYPNSDPRFRN